MVIYGGGNTALDAARAARRLDADEAIIVYRRTREKMPAHDFELEEVLQEGVSMKRLSTIKSADDGSMTIEKMKLDAPASRSRVASSRLLKPIRSFSRSARTSIFRFLSMRRES